MSVRELAECCKKAARRLNTAGTEEKNRALLAMADALLQNEAAILKANEEDLSAADERGTSDAMKDRLRLDHKRVQGLADAVRAVAALPDPVGELLAEFDRPNGLHIQKKSVAMGVIGIIYEARPNVTADAAALCFKAGSGVILRGGKEAIRSNCAIADAMRGALQAQGFSPDCVTLIRDTSRESSAELMRLRGLVDLLIPRGGAGLIRAVVENATVPVIETGVGNCHIYVDETADPQMAAEIVFNAKCSRPSVCNACETVLVHKNAAEKILPLIAKRLSEKQVELRGCPRTREILGAGVLPACKEDYATEFLDYILAVRVVADAEEAIEHIRTYSTGHSECIVTQSDAVAERFVTELDSAAVYVNASTRFTDGGEFGFGAEIGISTQKLHARGPMGLREMTSYRYIIRGNGQVR